MTTLYIWRAWSLGRARICDSGVAQADSAERAEEIARMCLGGPHAFEVVEIQVEPIRHGFVHVDSFDVDALLYVLAAAVALSETEGAKADAVYQAKVGDACARIKRIATDSMMLSPVAQEAMARFDAERAS